MEDISEKEGKRGRTRRLIALNNKTHPCTGARACDVATAGVSDEITPRRFRPRRCHYNITTTLPLCPTAQEPVHSPVRLQRPRSKIQQ